MNAVAVGSVTIAVFLLAFAAALWWLAGAAVFTAMAEAGAMMFCL